MTKPIGILGGTFDPVHNGHLTIAEQAYQQLDLASVLFIPCAQSPLKPIPVASDEHRLAMLTLALKNKPHFTLEEREIRQAPPSYTFDTLQTLQTDYPNTPLAFIIGIDAFIDLAKWHRWQDLFTLCHFIVVPRNKLHLPQEGILSNTIKNAITRDPQALSTQASGLLYPLKMDEITVSASKVRKQEDPQLPQAVADYIKRHGLYQQNL